MINFEEDIVLEGYGVTLRRLTHDKIEMLRQWRNDPKISGAMFYQQIITPEMQERWFANLDKKQNFYFIVCYKDEEIGLINVKNIDYDKMNGEFDYMYKVLNLAYTYSHMRTDNPTATRFAKFLGGNIDAVHQEQDSVKCVLTAEDYLNNRNRLRFIQKWEKLNKTTI